MSLSAGQRQRIGLARAVFGDPFLVVLDEPNANLDADGENALTRAIQILRYNKCIVIVISHRPSALAALNMAMVLYDGKSIAFGPCEEIFARVRTATGQSTSVREPAVARDPAAARQSAAARQPPAARQPAAARQPEPQDMKTVRRAPIVESVEP
jgi:ABC-type protease/lipase transport system fused ATPase/permease subunit